MRSNLQQFSITKKLSSQHEIYHLAGLDFDAKHGAQQFYSFVPKSYVNIPVPRGHPSTGHDLTEIRIEFPEASELLKGNLVGILTMSRFMSFPFNGLTHKKTLHVKMILLLIDSILSEIGFSLDV